MAPKKKNTKKKDYGFNSDDDDKVLTNDPMKLAKQVSELSLEGSDTGKSDEGVPKPATKKKPAKKNAKKKDYGFNSDDDDKILASDPATIAKSKAAVGSDDEDNNNNSNAGTANNSDSDSDVAPVAVASKTKAKGKKEKKSREERKRDKARKAEGKKKAEAESDEEPEVEEDVNTKTGASIYGYASGQKVGPDGHNPQEAYAVTGNLLSPPNAKDLQIDKLSLQAFGKMLIKDSEFTLMNGRRYGLIAPNGSGKSSLLHAIACGLVPLPDALDMYLLDREFGPTEMTSIEAVLDIVETEKRSLETEMEGLLSDPNKHAIRLDIIQERMQELEADGAERRALDILRGLQFSDERIHTKTKDLSGGWRMRISLARILFVKPTLMMLDEPTNHLDLEAVVWLEDYLTHNLEGHILLMTSHSAETLNEVCTDIVHLYHQKLDHYNGNYNTFTKVRADKDALLAKTARKQEKQMAKLKENLNKTGSSAQVQAKNKLKAMEKRSEKDKEQNDILQEEILYEKPLEIKFGKCGGGIPPPVLQMRDVKFGYPGGPILFENLNFGMDLKSRIALVGPNGAGKSTLIKLLLGKVEAVSGAVVKHHHLRMGEFNQHMGDQLDMSVSAVEWLCSKFKDIKPQEMRREIGRFGLTGKSHVIPMRQLSDGQRRRVLFTYLALHTPHIFLMDEPTNALDLETIDSLAAAINDYDGGVMLISHDFRLIDQVAEEIWIVADGKVTPWKGDIKDYKDMLKERYAQMRAEAEELAAAGGPGF